jgi:hypothetical protein
MVVDWPDSRWFARSLALRERALRTQAKKRRLLIEESLRGGMNEAVRYSYVRLLLAQ